MDVIISVGVLLALLAGAVALGLELGKPVHRAVRERIAIEASEDSYIKNGSDIIWYSDDKSTQKAAVYGQSGDGNFGGDVTAGGWITISAQTAFSVVNALPITPTGTYMPLTSATAVTCSTTTCIADGTPAGQLLLLENQNASSIIGIDATGANVECGATDVTLGPTDMLLLVWNATDWICLSNRDN